MDDAHKALCLINYVENLLEGIFYDGLGYVPPNKKQLVDLVWGRERREIAEEIVRKCTGESLDE